MHYQVVNGLFTSLTISTSPTTPTITHISSALGLTHSSPSSNYPNLNLTLVKHVYPSFLYPKCWSFSLKVMIHYSFESMSEKHLTLPPKCLGGLLTSTLPPCLNLRVKNEITLTALFKDKLNFNYLLKNKKRHTVKSSYFKASLTKIIGCSIKTIVQ